MTNGCFAFVKLPIGDISIEQLSQGLLMTLASQFIQLGRWRQWTMDISGKDNALNSCAWFLPPAAILCGTQTQLVDIILSALFTPGYVNMCMSIKTPYQKNA